MQKLLAFNKIIKNIINHIHKITDLYNLLFVNKILNKFVKPIVDNKLISIRNEWYTFKILKEFIINRDFIAIGYILSSNIDYTVYINKLLKIPVKDNDINMLDFLLCISSENINGFTIDTDSDMWYKCIAITVAKNSSIMQHYLVSKCINKTNPYNWKYIMKQAVKYDNIDLVKFVMNKYGNFKWHEVFDKATQTNNLPIIELLLNNGVNNYACAVKGAIKGNHLDLIKMFEDKLTNEEWKELLQIAINKNRIEIIKYIIETHNIKLSSSYICNVNNSIDMIRYIVTHCTENILHSSILSVAVKYNNQEIFDYAFENNVTFSTEILSHNILVAATNNHKCMINLLIQKGADLNYIIVTNSKTCVMNGIICSNAQGHVLMSSYLQKLAYINSIE
jgi:hypothetical protein